MSKLYQDPFGPAWRLNWLRLIFTWDASIFQIFWIEWVTVVILVSICLVALYHATKDANHDDLDAEVETLIFMLTFLSDRFQTAIGLMLGFYTGTMFGRWWSVRMMEGSVQGAIANISMAVPTMIRKPKDETVNVRNIKMQLVRWVNLSHALQVGEVYERKPNEFSSLEKLREIGLVTEPDYEWFQEHEESRYVAPLVWFEDLLMELRKKEMCGVTDITVKILWENVSAIRGGLGGLGLYADHPVPLSYRQLVQVTVRV